MVVAPDVAIVADNGLVVVIVVPVVAHNVFVVVIIVADNGFVVLIVLADDGFVVFFL